MMNKEQRLTRKNELQNLEAEMESDLKELGYGA